MRKFLNSNAAYRVISVLLAVLLWIYVNQNENPVVENVLDVPLETRELQPDLVVSEKPPTVQVRVQARRTVLERLSSRELRAWVSLAGARVGENFLPVRVSTPDGVELVSTNPSPARLLVEQRTSVQLPVKLVLKGRVAAGFMPLEPEIVPARVVVSGPERTLARMESVFVEADVSDRRADLRETLPVLAQNIPGTVSEAGISTTPSYVEVYVPVVPQRPAKVVPVTPRLSGEPEPGFVLERAAADPPLVQVFGPQETLDALQEILTAPVSVAGVRGQALRPARLELPPGVQLAREAQEVRVLLVTKPK